MSESPNLTRGWHDIPAEMYHGDPCPAPSLSCSVAKIVINECPMKAYLAHPRLYSGAKEDESTDAMDFGSLGHELVLGKGAGIVTIDADDWRSKDARAQRDAAQLSGKTPALQKNYDLGVKLVDGALREFSRLGFLETFTKAKKEITAIWQIGDIWLRCMMDAVHVDEPNQIIDIFDLKITEDATPETCIRQVGAMDYDLQAHFQRQACASLTGIMLSRIHHTFVFIEKKFPFLVTPLEMSEGFQMMGAAKFSYATAKWQDCLSTQRWPGYSKGIVLAEPKPWDVQKAQQLVGFTPQA